MLQAPAVATVVLPFERPIAQLLDKIAELRALGAEDPGVAAEVGRLEQQAAELARELFSRLTPIEKVQLARHANRPYTSDLASRLFTDWVELKGDRRFAEDEAIVAALARYRGRSVVVVGHQKGRSTKENVRRNFGMPHPEGYRKAARLFELGARFGLPILTFIDTPGAYPGIGAEERGQAEAIAASIAALCRAPVPVVATITGEGGSGGALALGVANKVFVLELGFYSVISPEGCAAILWKDAALAPEAAKQLKLTAADLYRLGIVDEIVKEPPGGAHQDYEATAALLDEAIARALGELEGMSPAQLIQHRYERYRKLGAFTE
ncbi:MAG: acetyl-CoA carboxylase carboxyltransferase subunit alpha [Deltaproteobacteria bacterium]|nr:acetyl-CoA carboxylase carboxyltransferase subunit alpha [Deltaproteobacteria bacterium]